MRRAIVLLAVCLLPAAALAASTEEDAGDVSEVDKDALGPLRERVPPVSGFLFLKRGRFEFSPGLGISTKDAFFTKYIPGALLSYYPTEHIGIGGRVGYGLNFVSGAAQICTQGENGGCRSPDFSSELDKRAPGQISLVGGLELQWAPIYGKISVIAERFLHFDMYALVGGTAVQYTGSGGPTMTFGANIGLGMRFFINKWLAVRTELRDLIYSEQFTNQAFLRNQILVDLGFSLWFPTAFEEG